MIREIIVIYDGECEFCKSCIRWISNRTDIKALANQSIDPNIYGITRAQCEKSVVVIDADTHFGAKAVAHLLERSGAKTLALILKASGPVGEYGYRYVASHREGRLVAALHWVVKKTA